MKYARIIAEFASQPWAIREDVLLRMREVLLHKASGITWSPEEIRARIDESNLANGYVPVTRERACFLSADGESVEIEAASGKKLQTSSPGSVALIPVVGIVSHRMSLMSELSGPGGASVQSITAQLRQALDDGNCKAIVLDVDSPGGSVSGVMELADEIYNARKKKPITAVCNAMACSAAYWLASAAEELVCTPSGQCGSIGVYMLHQDESKALENDGIKITLIKAGKYKAEGNPAEPLSDEARAAFQSQVDDYYGMFVKAVAQNRGTTQAKVRDGYGQGRSLLAASAVKAGLADRIATLDDVLGKYGVKRGSSPSSSAEGMDPVVVGAKPDNPDDDQDEDDNYCGCACDACKDCTGSAGNAKAQAALRPERFMGDPQGQQESCTCGCEACKACEDKGNAKAAHPISTQTIEEQKAATAAAAGDALKAIHRRRQMEIDLLRMP